MLIKTTKIAALLSAGTLLAASLVGCGGLGSGNVAKVYDRPITEAQMNKRAQELAIKSGGGVPGEEGDSGRFNSQAAHQLVVEELLRHEAAERGIEISEEEVQASYDAVLAQFGGTEEELLAIAKTSKEDILDGFRVRVIENKLKQDVTAGVVVNEDETMASYQKFVASYKTPEWRQLVVLVVGDQALAEELKKRLDAREDFGKLVSEYSTDEASKSKKGTVAFNKTREDLLPPEAKAAAFGAPIGELVGPVKTDKGYYIIGVVDVEPDKDTPFELVKPKFEERAREDKLAQTWDDFLKELEEKAEVIYRDDVKPTQEESTGAQG